MAEDDHLTMSVGSVWGQESDRAQPGWIVTRMTQWLAAGSPGGSDSRVWWLLLAFCGPGLSWLGNMTPSCGLSKWPLHVASPRGRAWASSQHGGRTPGGAPEEHQEEAAWPFLPYPLMPGTIISSRHQPPRIQGPQAAPLDGRVMRGRACEGVVVWQLFCDIHLPQP